MALLHFFFRLCFCLSSAHSSLNLQIASLTLMKDSERLDLLKEIGGTRVYEERRRESLKIMQETGKSLQFVQPSTLISYC